jgi:hypothetical protein
MGTASYTGSSSAIVVVFGLFELGPDSVVGLNGDCPETGVNGDCSVLGVAEGAFLGGAWSLKSGLGELNWDAGSCSLPPGVKGLSSMSPKLR